MRARDEGERLLDAAVRALTDSTGLIARVEVPSETTTLNATHAVIRLGEHRLGVEVIRRVDRVEAVRAAKTRREGVGGADRDSMLGLDGLVTVTDYLSPDMVKACRVIGLNAFDACGNAYLSIHGMLVVRVRACFSRAV
jgi:hypothetical protein